MSFIRPGRASASIAIVSGAIDRLSITTETATPEQIGIYAPTTASVAAGSTVTMRYRTTTGPGAWNTAHPLLRISTTGNETDGPTTLVDSFGGSIFDLTPGTQYDVELTHVESGQSTKTTTIQRTTRSLPAASGTTTVSATTADNLQTKFNALSAGDVLQLADGTYTVSSLVLSNSGTSGNPIFIRGATRAGVIIKDTTDTVLALNASHVVIENITIEGSSTDSGLASSSHGIVIGGARTNVTIRQINMVGVDTGITCDSGLTGTLVYLCDLRGNNPWSEASNENATWNDDGVTLAGFGNCAWNNTIKGFGDSFAVVPTGGSSRSEGIYFYRNRVLNNGDDLIEFDYGTRNIACYDNLITNTATAMSISYHYGGPVYYFRNIIINTIRGPYKGNAAGVGITGMLIYNNTIVRTDGVDGGAGLWGMFQTTGNGTWNNYSFRNNMLVYRGAATGGLLQMGSGGDSPCDFDYNAWYPDDSIYWADTGTNTTLATAKSELATLNKTPLFGSSQARMEHDLLTVTNPFATAITLGASHTTEYTAIPDATLSASGPQNDGVSIPGITDGFSGAAPDIGAVIAGRVKPSYGAVPAWVSNLATFTWTSFANTDPSTIGGGGCTAFSGAAYDTSRKQFIFFGGGHGDSDVNGVYAVRIGLDTPDRVVLKSNSTSRIDNPYYADGTPTSRHSYGSNIYHPGADRLITPICAAAWGVANIYPNMDGFSLASNTWDTAGTWPSQPSTNGDSTGSSSCVDTSGNIYMSLTNGSGDRIMKWTPTGGTYSPGSWSTWVTTTFASVWFDKENALAYDPTRNRLIYFGVSGFALRWDLSTGTETGITWSGANASSAYGIKTVSEYCADRDSFFITPTPTAGSGAAIYEVDAGTFDVTAVSMSGSAPVRGASPDATSAYNRFHLDNTLGIALLHNSHSTQNLYAFRFK